MLDKQSNSGSQLMHQAEMAERSGFSKKKEIKAADNDIEIMEEHIENLYTEHNRLKKALEAEKLFYQQKDDEINSNFWII